MYRFSENLIAGCVGSWTMVCILFLISVAIGQFSLVVGGLSVAVPLTLITLIVWVSEQRSSNDN